MRVERIALIAICAAAVGLGLVQTSRSQPAAKAQYEMVAGGILQGNFTSIMILDTTKGTVYGCQYQGGGPVSCAKASLPN